MATRSKRTADRDPQRILRSVVGGLPGTAAAMYTLMTVGPEAREPLFRNVSAAASDIDRARSSLMIQVKDLPVAQRAPAILVAQTVSLLASMMVATSRVAAQGRPDALPQACHETARVIVELTDQAALLVPRQRGPATQEADAAVGHDQVLRLLAEVSDQLDRLLGMLTTRPADVVPPRAAGSRDTPEVPTTTVLTDPGHAPAAVRQ